MNWAAIDNALSDPGFFVDHDPHPLWQQLRRDDPIHWTEGSGRPFWSITRYDDIIAVVSEPALFSSEYLLAIPSSPEMERVTPAILGCGEMMLLTDPPLHGAMRRAFNRLMLPRAVGRFEVPGALLVREILDQAVARSECDFVVDVAAQLPMAFICEIMGIPRGDWPQMFKVGEHGGRERGSRIPGGLRFPAPDPPGRFAKHQQLLPGGSLGAARPGGGRVCEARPNERR
jgi:cholest-4-en-3-one 26-monooxygenase